MPGLIPVADKIMSQPISPLRAKRTQPRNGDQRKRRLAWAGFFFALSGGFGGGEAPDILRRSVAR